MYPSRVTIKVEGRANNRLRRRAEGEQMRERTLITTGAVGAVLAAICCATPLLAAVLGALGLAGWLAKADYVVIPALILCLGLIGFGLYRRRVHRG